MKRSSSALVAILLAAAALIGGCGDRHTRGRSERSGDGKTYLVVAENDGENCPPIWLDGKLWQHAIGEKVEVAPGDHTIICGSDANPDQGTEFTVAVGTVYYFDYWGP